MTNYAAAAGLVSYNRERLDRINHELACRKDFFDAHNTAIKARLVTEKLNMAGGYNNWWRARSDR